jgi:heme a synthase
MPSFRKLALASTAATLLLVAVGGLVRATGSGLGCGDDWPDCNGQLIPVLNARPVIIEWSHRAIAMVVGILVVLLVVRAFAEHRGRPAIIKASIAALVLVVFQALLGRVVVKEELEVLLVMGHLTTAMLFLGVLIAIVVLDARVGDFYAGANSTVAGRAGFAALAVLVLLLVGSYTSDFGYMPGWPLQNGRFIPNLAVEGEAVHFLHRILAAGVAVIVGYVYRVTVKGEDSGAVATALARAGAILFAIELFVGAANVWTTLHPLVVTMHLLIGATVWSCMVGLWAVSSPALMTSVQPAAHPAAGEVVEVRG